MKPCFIHSERDFAQVVRPGETMESLVLDFKRIQERTKSDSQLELSRDVVQFANTDGGCLIIGVPEVRRSQGLKVAGQPTGLTNPDGDREWIERAISNHVVPNTIRRTVAPISIGSKTILVVNVPPNPSIVAVFDRGRGTMQFPFRTSHGKDYMSPPEALATMRMEKARGTRIRLQTLLEAHSGAEILVESPVFEEALEPPAEYDSRRADARRRLYDRFADKMPLPELERHVYWRESKLPGTCRLEELAEFEMRLCVSQAKSFTLPYEFVDTMWSKSSGRVALWLSVAILFRLDGSISLSRLSGP